MIENYLLLLEPKDREAVQNYLQRLTSNELILIRHQKLLIEILKEKPYPVIQLLLLQWLTHKEHIKPLLIQALEQLLNDVLSKKCLDKFFIFLTESPEQIFENLSEDSKNNLKSILAEVSAKKEFYLCLLSRRNEKLISNMMELFKEIKWQYYQQPLPSAEYILYQAMEKKTHFITLITRELNEFKVLPNELRFNFIILRLVDNFSNSNQDLMEVINLLPLMDELDLSKLPKDLETVYKHFFKKFRILLNTCNFIQKRAECRDCMQVQNVLETSSILDMIMKWRLKGSYDELKTFLVNAYETENNSLLNKELNIFNYYYCLTIIYDLITYTANNGNEKDSFIGKVQLLNVFLRQQNDLESLCQLLEDISQMVFLRYDVLNKEIAIIKKCNRKSSDTSYTDEDDEHIQKSYKHALKSLSKPTNGNFLCRGKVLYQIFNVLKSFITKKLHSNFYKMASKDLQERFQNILEYINIILCKYDIVENLQQDLNRVNNKAKLNALQLKEEKISQLIKPHKISMEKDSSSEDNEDFQDFENSQSVYYSRVSRRKANKKYRRATFSGGTANDHTEDTFILKQCRARANTLVNTLISKDDNDDDEKFNVANKFNVNLTMERSIIPKILGTPEQLVVIAISLKNFNEAKHIIENFNLQNTPLSIELNHVEQQQQIEHKLLTVYESYQRTEEHLQNVSEPTTVEQIRSVAAKGFEVSKIRSIIDQFAQAQRIQQSDTVKQLLNKYKHNPQYRFLQMFDEANLNAIIICDLVLTLPLNRDIISSVLMIIKHQQLVASNFSLDTFIESSQFGALKLLENLCDCLRLLPNKNLKDLLSNNTYSLRPHLVAKELEREKVFKEIFYKSNQELQQIEDLKSLITQFQKLNSKFKYHQRFSVYMDHLNRLVKLRYPKNEYLIEDLLKIDPCDIIGDLIFVCNMTPLEIENNVFALNLNLVHIIALNICPEIIDRKRTQTKHSLPPQKLQTIYNYINHHNSLLSYLLKAINSHHHSSDQITELFNSNFKVFERFLNLSEIEKLSILYEGNKVITALRSDHINMKLFDESISKLKKMELIELEMGLQDIGIGKSQLLDELVLQLIAEDSKNIYLATKVSDIKLRARLIQDNFTKIATTRLAKELIESTLEHRDAKQKIPSLLSDQLEVTLADITVYAKVSEVMKFETWPQAYDFGLKTPNAIFECLLQLQLYSLCYEWCKVVKLDENFKAQRKAFLSALLEALLTLTESDDDDIDDEEKNKKEKFQYLLWILETFPSNICLEFWTNNKDRLRSLYLLKYAVAYMQKYDVNGLENYRNYQISLLIFGHLTPSVRQQFWNLLKFPLLIIEQLIMNTKFELLNKILQTVRKELKPQEKYTETNGTNSSLCPFCFDKHGHIYDIRSKSDHKPHFQLGSSNEGSSATAFILLNFNLYQKDHLITNDCIDLLLRIYATKALDYHVSDVNSNSEPCSQSTTDTQQSLDSLYEAFQMPKHAPNRKEWVRDEEASHCMCCRRAAFTMLMRRHHCRRCGRVVCFACSLQRMRLPELYEDVEVRICNDCYRCSEDINQRKICRNSTSSEAEDVVNIPVKVRQPFIERFKWKLSGSITHDKLLREEFCYEHSPSVALCLSILEYHEDKQKAVNLLLYHCRKLENLMIPNPEIDYELVAKMMNCLAVAAKVRGAPAEVETILEHSEIIISVVQNGCESLIPRDPLSNHGLRKLADSLLQAERWDLGLEVHLKCGFPTAGLIKRPQHGPPLLREILKLIESLPLSKPQPETLQRASIIRNSSSSLVSLLSLKRKDNFVKRIPEPALNVLNTLANLKRITKGQYSSHDSSAGNRNQLLKQSHGYEECLHYVLTYGSHADIVQFLIKHHELKVTLNYYLIQKLEAEIFMQYIYMESLKSGQVSQLIKQLQEYDDRLIIWRPTLLHTCRCLETQKMFNSLYQLQILLQDPIRASMTCVKFYTMNCDSFQQQHANAQHLRNAHLHLQSELELMQWENINSESLRSSKSINSNRRSSVSSNSSITCGGHNFLLQMDARSLNVHINTILRQLEVAKFLAKCEMEDSKEDSNSGSSGLITEKILKKIRLESSKTLPTLFDGTPEKIQICLLMLLCDYKLTSLKIYASAAKYLARNQRLAEVDVLLSCITSNNGISNQDIDEILTVAINSAINTHETEVKTMLDNLTKRIHNIEMRISSHIFIGQLKSAYLLANKYERLGDIRKILRQAEATNQIHIKKLCEKKLQMSSTLQQQT
uniref:FYVE-type domain-containing protein n=1 Tax=Glossina brevipalpis TaxID=37001 RepID=A0A1A9WGU3_9MUSC